MGEELAPDLPTRDYESTGTREPAPLKAVPAAPEMPDVLIIEDDDLVQTIILECARQVGMTARAVASYEEATPYLVDVGPNVIVLDLDLPGIDGIAALRLFSEARLESRIIITSGIDDAVIDASETTARAYGLDVRATLRKPVPVNQLQQTLVGCKGMSRSSTDPDIAQALADDGFVNVYQPKIALGGNAAGSGTFPHIQIEDNTYPVVAMETLARLPDAEGRLCSPLAYLGPRNGRYETGLFAQQVIKRANEDLADIYDRFGDLRVSVNVVPGDLHHLFNADHAPDIGFNGKSLSQFNFEIAADHILLDSEDYLAQLEALSRNGQYIAFDNVADGFSSYVSLREIQFSEIKLDRTLIREIDKSAKAIAVARAVIEMGHALGAKVTAVGVETRAAAETIAELGFDYAQGNYFHPPAVVADLKVR